MRKLFILISFIVIFGKTNQAIAQCPGCLTTLPDTLPADTIYLSDAAAGRAGAYYDTDVSFRMPKTTTPVAANDPSVVPGITINQITITSVSNLPPGLTWEANQTVFTPSELTDGCVKFCGTPLQPGLYEVEVVVTAQVFVISQTTSFSFPILIEPAVSVTEGFLMENNTGCGEVRVHFENKIASGGNPGFSYRWDFGNGRTTIDENPVDQTYSQPGIYEVNYQAIVDTFGYVLTNIRIENMACNDLFGGKPDPQLEIYDPEGLLIYKSDIARNVSPPIDYNLNLKIGTGNYYFRVTDDDDGIEGGDDECGVINFNQLSNGSLSDVEMQATIHIFHRVDTIKSKDTVQVFQSPAAPVLIGADITSFCKGDTARLKTNYEQQLQWYKDNAPVLNGTEAFLNATTTGTYWVAFTSENGCTALSDPVALTFAALPAGPVFVNEKNLLRLFDATTLPLDYTLQWFYNEMPIAGADQTTLCANASGTYALELMDNATGCTSHFSRPVAFDPNFAGCGITSTAAFDQLVQVRLYPNPADTKVWLEFVTDQTQEDIHLAIRNAQGALLQQHIAKNGIAGGKLEIAMENLPAGLYFFELQVENARKTFKVLKTP